MHTESLTTPQTSNGTGRVARGLIIAWLALGPMLMLSTIWTAPTSAGEDDVVYYYPLRTMVGQSLAELSWPRWNAYELCGAGLFADPQAATMHPPTWLFAVLAPKPAYSLNVFVAFSLAGLGAYLYLRRIGLAPAAGVFGATAFQYCGFMVGHRVHLSMIQAACMLGFGLWAIELLRVRPTRALVHLPWIVFLALSAGHWPTFVYLLLIWGVYFAVRARPLGRGALVVAGGVLVALLIAAPQIQATAEALGQTTRRGLGYAVFAENSFLPTNYVLAFFPFVMGCRTPGFFCPRSWWGAWHLCESLGYVGLVTLALAAGAAWRLWRRGNGPHSGLVKLWCLLGAGAGVWMLGYYLPTYRLVHMIPVLNIVRAPSRMVIVVDFALATLAAVAIHTLLTRTPRASESGEKVADEPLARLARTVWRWAIIYLPAVMIASLGLLALGTAIASQWYPERLPWPFSGSPADVWASINPLSVTVWVPLAVLAASAAGMLIFLRAPWRHAMLPVCILAADLLILTQNVDVPGNLADAVDPESSLAASFIKADAGDRPFRVLHLTEAYYTQAPEALAPKASAVFGVENLAGYGPFQPDEHAHLFGLRIFGTGRSREWLIRRNYLLSLYNVRYIIAAERFAAVVESVVVPPADHTPVEGPNLLDGPCRWRTHRATLDGDAFSLVTDSMIDSARAETTVAGLQGGRVYRIELQARGPQGPAGWLQAAIDGVWTDQWTNSLVVDPELMSQEWRTFTWTFQLPFAPPGPVAFRLQTLSETPIEVRGLKLFESEFETPINLGNRLRPGERVYLLLAVVPPERRGESPVYIYRNQLCLDRAFEAGQIVSFNSSEQLIEQLKWHADQYDLTRQVLVVGRPDEAKPWRFVSVSPVRDARALAELGYSAYDANGYGVLTDAPPGVLDQVRGHVGLAGRVVMVIGLAAYLAIVLLAGRAGRRREGELPGAMDV